jgi:diguanylate cyclase (GGDEF)-like protein
MANAIVDRPYAVGRFARVAARSLYARNRLRRKRRLFGLPLVVAVFWVCPCAAGWQAPILVLEEEKPAYSLSDVLGYLEDPRHQLAVNAVAAMSASFRPAGVKHREVNFGYSGSAFWLAFSVRLAPGAPTEWFLELAHPSLDRVEVYSPRRDGGFDVQLAGDLQPFSARPFPHRNLVFPLKMAPGETQTVYARISSEGTLTVPAKLWQSKALQVDDQRNYALVSLYYGMLLALLLYNVLLFATVGAPIFLTYVGFAASIALGMASWNGLGNQFLWPEWPLWGNMALPAGMAGTGFFAALFTRQFLGTREAFPYLDRVLIALAVAFSLAALAPVVALYRFSAILTSVTGIVFSAVAVFAGVHCAVSGRSGARYFLVAWSLFLVGAAVLAMRNFAWLPTTTLTIHSMQIGSALEMLLLSFAVGQRINAMRGEKEHAGLEASAAREINEHLLKKEKALEHMARHDPLTGLANRIVLRDCFAQAAARARRSGCSVALLLVDLDGFKAVNDRHGHAAGDKVLVTLAQRFLGIVRESDNVARIGGDEFVIVLQDLEEPAIALRVADRLLAAAREEVVLLPGLGAEVSASIGIAFYPKDAGAMEPLLKCSDQAMYAAKAAGRNRWHRA